MQKTFLYLLLLPPLIGAAQPFDFVQKIEGNRYETITDMVFTKHNDYVVSGVYEDEAGATFQSTNGKNTTILPNQDTFKYSHSTLFLAKYNQKGAVKWVVNAFAEDGIHPWDLACDSLGNLIVCGNFRGVVVFNSANKKKSKTLNGLPKRNFGAGEEYPLNSFVAKYDPNGTLLWVKLGLSPQHSVAFQAETDAQNNIYIRLYCHYNAISFDKYSILPGTKTYLQSYHCMVMKCLPNGEEDWVAYGGSPSGSLNVRGMTVSKSGNVSLDIAIYGSFLLHHTSGAFFQKKIADDYKRCRITLDKRGLVAAMDTIPSLTRNETGFPNIKKSVTNAKGDQYMIMTAEDIRYTGKRTLTWDGKTIVAQDKDIFLAKADAQNKPIWLIQLATKYDELPLDIALDKRGNVLIAGWYWDEMTVKGCFGDSVTLHSDRLIGLFVASFTEKGELNWAQNCGKNWGLWRNEPNLQLAVSSDNKLFAYGQIDTPCEFGNYKATILGELQTTVPKSEYAAIMFKYPDAFITQIDLRKMPDKSMIQPIAKTDTALLANNADTTRYALAHNAGNAAEIAEIKLVENPNSAILYPNPVSKDIGIINIDLTASAEYAAMWTVLDSNGKLISQTTENIAKGLTHKQLSFAGFPPGVYILTIQLGKNQLVKRVVVV
jgi:hypothetical protein